jgi:cell division protein FtsZ
VQQVAAQEQAEDIFEEVVETGQDGLPQPAYQPQVPAFQPQIDAVDEQPGASFVAPKAPAPGTPSADAIVRLQAAAARAQGQQRPMAQSAPMQAAPTQQPQYRPAAASHDAEPQSEQRRFGLNSLIHRMTGSAAETQAAKPQPVRQQPPVQQQAAAPQPQPVQQQESDAEQDRIEIPAFLRRQAN